MAGWGVSLLGYGATVKALENFVDIHLDDDVVYITGTRVIYAVHQEFGTSKMSANPFLGPAARKAQRELPQIVGDANTVGEAVKRVALFIEREASKLAPHDTGNLTASIVAAPEQDWPSEAESAALDPETVV